MILTRLTDRTMRPMLPMSDNGGEMLVAPYGPLGPSLDSRSIARAMTVLCVAGPGLLGLWLILPHAPGAHEGALLTLAGASLLIGLLLLIARPGRSRSLAVHAAPFLGTIDLTLALIASRTPTSGFAFLFLWTVTWTFLVGTWRLAGVHLGLMAACLVVAYSTFTSPPTWGTCAVAVVTVGITGALARTLALAMNRADIRFRTGFRESSIGIALVTPEGGFLEVNGALCRLLGRTREVMLTKSPRDMCFPGEAELLDHHFGLALDGAPQRFRKRCVHADGGEIHALIDLAVVGEQPPMILVHAQDVSGEVRAERELCRRLEQQRTIARFASEALDASTPGSAVQAAVGAASALFDGAPTIVFQVERAGSGPADGVPLRDPGAPDVAPSVAEALRTRKPVHDPDGSYTHAVTIPGEQGPWGVLAVRDVSSTGPDDLAALDSVAQLLAASLRRSTADARLRHHELHDHLTGLPNRALILDRLASALDRAVGDGKEVTALLADLDGFAVVNDSLGHEAGDRLLVDLSRRLRAALPPTVELGRFGSDEFVVVAEVSGGVHEAVDLARTIERVVHQPITAGDRLHFPTVSIGIALGSGGADRADALISDADAAMHQAKDRGRARYELFDSSLRNAMAERLHRQAELRCAIAANELRVFYQPIVDAHGLAPRALEALVRWEHPEHGLLAAGEFVPLAEACGLIGELGDFVLRQACRDLAEWRERFAQKELEVWVNVSGEQLVDPTFGSRVQAAISDAGVPASGVVLELTESMLIADPDVAGSTIAALRSLGIRFALDDFGMGHSALGTLHRFSFDALKIDRSFVGDIFQDEQCALVQAIVDMGQALSLKVVAEGVENPDQLTLLRRLGCDFVQGFMFERPMPARDVPRILRSNEATVYSLAGGPRDRGGSDAARQPRSGQGRRARRDRESA